MGYLTQNDIANNGSMNARVAQAAVSEGIPGNPDQWAYDTRRSWAAAPGWDAAWESYKAGHPDDPNADPGADEGVITDGMILSQVQAMKPPPPPEPESDPDVPDNNLPEPEAKKTTAKKK